MNKQAKKVIKIVLLVLLAAIIITAIAGWAVFEFVVKPNANKVITAIDSVLEDEEIIAQIKPYLNDEELARLLGEQITVAIEDGVTNDANATETAQPPSQDVDTSAKQQPDKVVNEEVKKDKSEYASQYDYIKSNVAAADFSRGLEFVARVDVGYILGLLKDGLTVPEKRELKAYLQERFSSSEIAEGVSLYTKYSYLLN